MESMRELIGLLLPVLLVFASRYVYQAVEDLAGIMKRWPVLAKRMSVVVVSFALTKTAVFLGLPLPGDLAGLTPEVILAILQALGAMGLHKLAKKTA